MREPPRLTQETIARALHAQYAISVRDLTFLPLGADSESAAYRVRASDGGAYFLKVRTAGGFGAPSVLAPRYLSDQGVPHVIAPLHTIDRSLWVDVGEFALSLYPYVDARAAADVGLSERHWRALGAMLKQVHASRLTADMLQVVRREPYVPGQRSLIADLESAMGEQAQGDGAQRQLAAFWRGRRDEIRALVERADALAHEVRRASLPLVLCHGDLHTWNVLVDTAQQLWVVDWDETILAPKERDLMFVVNGIGRGLVEPHDTACFFEGYGEVAVDQCALAYYRYAWAVQDIAAYGEQALFLRDLGDESRGAAVRGLMDLFEPGNIVAIALGSDGAAC